MKLKEKEELLKKIAELQKQVDNAVIENDNPFNLEFGDKSYYNDYKTIYEDRNWCHDTVREKICCKDISIIKTRQKREKLNALLEKFAYENDSVVTEDMWGLYSVLKFEIVYSYKNKEYEVECLDYAAEWAEEEKRRINSIYFRSEEVAKRAVDEVVIPFMKEYDD